MLSGLTATGTGGAGRAVKGRVGLFRMGAADVCVITGFGWELRSEGDADSWGGYAGCLSCFREWRLLMRLAPKAFVRAQLAARFCRMIWVDKLWKMTGMEGGAVMRVP